MLASLLTHALNGIVVLLVAWVLPSVKVRSFLSAVFVAAVYSVLHGLLFNALAFLALPFAFLTFGLALFGVNLFLVWLTDKLIPSFEIRSFGGLFLTTLALTVGGWFTQGVAHMFF